MTDTTHNNAHEAMKAYVQRYERLMDERDAAMEEFKDAAKDLRSEIKSAGFNMKAFNEVLRRRKWERTNDEDAKFELSEYEGILA